ncbi:ABC transporter substrate-binding protein [Paenibacillus sp. UNC451MF]|uniref:ABC transporter substrate-binding protein n=1 Tax=Paenibacillus sp. UNC451MF TaxID=1449063 RepID=UPI00048ADA46|nr:extracellular solute-binding protein [Paenibacillus sp. UNC451MF]
MPKSIHKVIGTLCLIGALTAAASGCSSKNPAAEKTSNPNINASEPVELKVFSGFAETAIDFDDVFVKPVQKKHPNISAKLVNGVKLENLVSTGDIPDLIVVSVLNLFPLKEMGLLSDLNPLIKQHSFDLSRIHPEIMDSVKQYSEIGEIVALPYFINFNALYYNKDIFDRFGVAYPKDGMTWDEVLELAKKVTQTVDGVNYRGLDPENITRLASSLGVQYADSNSTNGVLQNWKPGYELFQRIMSIPGNLPSDPKKFDKNAFVKDRTVAMVATTNMLKDFQTSAEQGQPLNWDMVTYPQYKEKPGTFGVAGARVVVIPPQSKHREEAFRLLESILSDEAQMEQNKNGLMSALVSPEVQKTFGSGIEHLKGKNVQAAYKLKPGWRVLTPYDDSAAKIILNHSADITKGKDINSVIRETDEEIGKMINQLK